MRRHKEQEAAEEAAGSPETVTPSTAVDSSEVALPSFARPQPAAKPTSGVVSRQPAALPREAPMVAVARGRGPVTGDTAVPATSTPSPDEPVRLSAESPVVTPVEFSAEAPKLQAALADDTLVALPQEMNITVNAESKPAMDAASLTSSPLQTVWPVQTVQRETTPPTPLSPEAAPFAVPSEPPVRPPTPQDFWVEERLAAVPPGMPTDSSVPLLRPRRPRPGRATPPVAGVMAGSPPLADATTAVSPTVQRQTEAAVGLVPTEIGTLPPDLWTLIGQQPPEVTASREVMASPEAMAPAPPMSAGSPVVQRSADGVATAVPPLRDAPTSSPSVLSDYIQLEEGEEASRPTAAPGEGGEETAEKKENEEIDINELARQVYAHIRNQLTIDKERERGRLIHKW